MADPRHSALLLHHLKVALGLLPRNAPFLPHIDESMRAALGQGVPSGPLPQQGVATGDAALWMQRHPYAMQHGGQGAPGFVQNDPAYFGNLSDSGAPPAGPVPVDVAQGFRAPPPAPPAGPPDLTTFTPGVGPPGMGAFHQIPRRRARRAAVAISRAAGRRAFRAS